MKKAYIIRMSEDGNDQFVYTNIKVLFNGIIETGYDVQYIMIYNPDTRTSTDLKFTYSNLVKALKNRSVSWLYKEVNGGGYGSLEIQEVSIRTK